MSQLRIVAGRIFTPLWVATLGFLALAHPAHVLFESPTDALIAQSFGSLMVGSFFALRGAIRQQYERLSSFLLRSRGLRAAVRTLLVNAIAAPRSEVAAATSRIRAVAPNPARSDLVLWQNPSGVSSEVSAETSPQTAVSAPQRPTPSFPTTTA